MTHVRQDLRDAARAALVAALPAVSWPRSWWHAAADVQQPRGAVATPEESVSRQAVGLVGRRIEVMVIVRRVAGDTIEDMLDDDSAAIEAALMPVMAARSTEFDLVETRVRIDGQAEKPIGELVMRFAVEIDTDEGVATI